MMDAITKFLIGEEMGSLITNKSVFGCLLFILLFIFFFILSFSIVLDISKKYKGWKPKLIVFLIALFWLLTILLTIFRNLEFFKIPFLNLPEIFLLSMYNTVFFLYLLQRFKRLYIAILGIILLNPLIIFSIEEWIAFGSLMSCESEHPGYSVGTDKGYYPIHGEVEPRRCPITDVLYEWTRKRYSVNDDPSLMLVWDGKPHGFIFKWRKVAFLGKRKGSLDRNIRRIPEKEFQKLLKEQQGRNP